MWEKSLMFFDWGSADYFSNISSLILFVIAWWLGKRQGLIIDRIDGLTQGVHRLQTAVAALQVREKIGVIHQAASSIDTRPHAAVTLVSDSISVLDVYPFAPKKLQRDYIKALDTAFASLHQRTGTSGTPMQLELALAVVLYAKSLFDQGQRNLAISLIEPIARCASNLHKLEQSSRPEGIDLGTEACESKTKILEQLLSTSETELTRKLRTEVFHIQNPGTMAMRASGTAQEH
nr:hypothetical protein [Gammaproteobacteria bacterium]